MYARLLSLHLMLELAVRRSGIWEGKKDVKTEDNKDKAGTHKHKLAVIVASAPSGVGIPQKLGPLSQR